MRRFNPVKNVDFSSVPNYTVANVPILSYILIGITTLTLGYITIKDKEGEDKGGLMDVIKDAKDSIGDSVKEVGEEAKDMGNSVKDKAESILEKGGRLRQKQKSKTKSKSKSKSKKTYKKK